MGIYISTKKEDGVKFQCGYGAFHQLRIMLAYTIGVDLESMQGFSKKHPKDPEYCMVGLTPWQRVKSDLKPLLMCSDCQGKIDVKDCKRCYPVLAKILDLWDDGTDAKHLLEQLTLVFREAVETKQGIVIS